MWYKLLPDDLVLFKDSSSRETLVKHPFAICTLGGCCEELLNLLSPSNFTKPRAEYMVQFILLGKKKTVLRTFTTPTSMRKKHFPKTSQRKQGRRHRSETFNARQEGQFANLSKRYFLQGLKLVGVSVSTAMWEQCFLNHLCEFQSQLPQSVSTSPILLCAEIAGASNTFIYPGLDF